MATATRDSTPDAAGSEPGAERAGLSRAVTWTGIALGTCLAVLAMSDGARLRIGGMPAWLGIFLGAVLVWVLIVMASVTLAELTRRHHKTARRYAVRQGKRGGLAAGRAARRRWRALMARAAAWAGPRWRARRPAEPRGEPAAVTAPAVTPPRRVCAACGNLEGGKFGPLVTYREAGPGGGTHLIHRAHFEDPATGYHGQPYTRGPAAGTASTGHPPPSTEGTPMTPNLTGLHSGPGFGEHTFAECSPGLCGEQPGALARKYASRITPDRRARRTAARTGGSIPSEWGPVVAQAADFEPESDAHLLDWMAGQVTGMAGYAEALIEAYETGTGAVGIDPKGLAALHDVADAAAHAAETMSGARTKFADHYELPREFAANGGLMTHDGRWVTGEGG